MPETRRPLLEIQMLSKTYTQGRWWQRQFRVRALENVNLILEEHTTLALIGDSGAGKSTLAMCIAGLEQADSGSIRLGGMELGRVKRARFGMLAKDIQMIFQDSAGALSPRMSAVQIVEEPLRIRGDLHRQECQRYALEAIEQVGIPLSCCNRSPHELSGGQRQRLAIARAIVLKPRLLILDEPLSGLDPSIQGQISNLLLDVRASYGLSYLYISHHIELVSRIADEIALMQGGRIVRQAKTSEIPLSEWRRVAMIESRISVPRADDYAAEVVES